ncbi:MAG: hypothetical protein ABI461_20570 [Polyangiaceae bacterium]
MRISLFVLAALLVTASALVAEGCATSTEGDDQNPGSATSDSGGGEIDGSPILAGDSGDEDSGEITDSGVVIKGDGGCVLTPPSNKCGIFPNCGCAGTTCDFVLDSGAAILPTACTPSVGTAVGGAACTESTDCIEGLTCLFDRCHPFCEAEGPSCGGIYSDCHNHASTTGYNICGIKCDLSSASSCGMLGCVGVSSGSGNATSECEPVGTAGNGAACTSVLDCAPGFNCVNVGTMQCKQTCKTVAPACTTGTCTGLATTLVVDGVTYGYCN